MLKLSIQTSAYYGTEGCRSIFENIKKIGYDAVDYQCFMSEPGTELYTYSDAAFEARTLADAQAAKEIGLTIGQTHCPWPYDDTKPELAGQKFDAMIRALAGTAILGAPYMVIHPVMPSGFDSCRNIEADTQANIDFLQRLLPHARHYGVKLALENMPFPGVACAHAYEIARVIDAVNHPNLVACLDTGHCAVVGDDVGDAVRVLGSRLHCLHIHDNDGKCDLHRLPYFGVINWNHFISALREIKFQDTLSLETSAASAAHLLSPERREALDHWLFETLKEMGKKADYLEA